MKRQCITLGIPPIRTDRPVDCLAAFDIGLVALAKVTLLGETPEAQLRRQCLEQLGVDAELIPLDAFLTVGDALSEAWYDLLKESSETPPCSLLVALGLLAANLRYIGGDEQTVSWEVALTELAAVIDDREKLYGAHSLVSSLDGYWWQLYEQMAPALNSAG